MKKLCYTLTIICLVTSNLWAAGSSTVTPAVSEDVRLSPTILAYLLCAVHLTSAHEPRAI